MIIGSLGDVVFYTSINESILLNNLDWSTSARYKEHTRHSQTDMLEYVGDTPDKINIEIKLSAFLGVNPTNMLDRLNTLIRNHEAVKFVVGNIPIPGHWVITYMERKIEHLHKDGSLLSCIVKITLMEYIKSINMPIISNRISFTDRMKTSNVIYPKAGAKRKPVIPPSDRPVRINTKPVTRKTKKKTTTAAKSTGIVGLAVKAGIKVVKAVSDAAKKYNVVEVLKNAISNRDYNSTKDSTAKPVVDRKDSGVNPNSFKHSKWVHTVK